MTDATASAVYVINHTDIHEIRKVKSLVKQIEQRHQQVLGAVHYELL